MNFLTEENVTAKFNICQNCRYNYADKLLIAVGVAEILCSFCKGIGSNYEPLTKDDREELSGGRDVENNE